MTSDAIIQPRKGKRTPDIGPVAILAATRNDIISLCNLLDLCEADANKLFISSLYVNPSRNGGISLTGPMIGAPYAIMIFETLVAWGARKFIFLGWCGAISKQVKTGDIIVPTAAIIDEGTSPHYIPDLRQSQPSQNIVGNIKAMFSENDVVLHEGPIWTTDAVYRETRDQVHEFQKKGILAVEMETSAVFSVAKYRSVEAAALLVVSDELYGSDWKPGFKQQRFQQGRTSACRMVSNLCQIL